MPKQTAQPSDDTQGNWIVHDANGEIRLTVQGSYGTARLNCEPGDIITSGVAHPDRNRVQGRRVVKRTEPPAALDPPLPVSEKRRQAYLNEIGVARQLEALLDADKGDRTKLDALHREIASVKKRFPK
jgi:hypothetical protein